MQSCLFDIHTFGKKWISACGSFACYLLECNWAHLAPAWIPMGTNPSVYMDIAFASIYQAQQTALK